MPAFHIFHTPLRVTSFKHALNRGFDKNVTIESDKPPPCTLPVDEFEGGDELGVNGWVPTAPKSWLVDCVPIGPST